MAMIAALVGGALLGAAIVLITWLLRRTRHAAELADAGDAVALEAGLQGLADAPEQADRLVLEEAFQIGGELGDASVPFARVHLHGAGDDPAQVAR